MARQPPWQDLASYGKQFQNMARYQGAMNAMGNVVLLVYDVSGLEANGVSIKFPQQQIFNACLTTPHELPSF